VNQQCMPDTWTRAFVRMAVPVSSGQRFYRPMPNGGGTRPVTLIGALTDGYCLKGMFPVDLTVDESGWHVVTTSVFPVHGDGESDESALDDFRLCLAEYYELVEEGAQSGDPYDVAELRRLQFHITRR
jgi:hypothetical protein